MQSIELHNFYNDHRCAYECYISIIYPSPMVMVFKTYNDMTILYFGISIAYTGT